MAEGGLRERRLGNERAFLEMLLSLNAGRLEVVTGWTRAAGADAVRLRLKESPAYRSDGSVAREHTVRIVFPEYFPATPTEAWLGEPVRHPNVHPVNGFICLWAKPSPGDTIVETLLQVQRVIAWHLWNDNPEHVMQPEAGQMAPLGYEPLRVPERYYLEKTHARREGANLRRRLSPLSE